LAVVELVSNATARNGMRFDNHYRWVVRFTGNTIVEVRAYLDSAMVAELFRENPVQGLPSREREGPEHTAQIKALTERDAMTRTGAKYWAAAEEDGRVNARTHTGASTPAPTTCILS
jgi:hypothetical protein